MNAGPSMLIGNDEALAFILDHEGQDPYTLSLKHSAVAGVPFSVIARQIESRQKARIKLPQWHATPGIIFPDPVFLQQSSSEATAKYKATLVRTESVADLTGGTGIDLFYLSEKRDASYFDINPDLCALVRHNYSVLHKSAVIQHSPAEKALASLLPNGEIYLDPSRRDNKQRKMVGFADCSPDVTALLPDILQKSEHVMLKASPMMDIRQAIISLNYHAREVHVVEWENECKEILFILDRQQHENPTIIASDTSASRSLRFNLEEEAQTTVQSSGVENYLYEPSPAILKAGAFKIITRKFPLQKLHQNTHLYSSNSHIAEFPGRIFKVLENVPYHPARLREMLPSAKANITVRNFPESVAQIRKKLRLTDGGDSYLFAYTDYLNRKMICITERIPR